MNKIFKRFALGLIVIVGLSYSAFSGVQMYGYPFNPTLGNITATGSITGDGAGITNLNASNIPSGTLANARLPQDISITGYSTAETMKATSMTATTFTGALAGNASTADYAILTATSSACSGNASTATTAVNVSGGYVTAESIISNGNLTVSGELKGCRESITFSLPSTAFGVGAYAWMNLDGNAMSGTYGWVMPRAGSIVGLSQMVDCTIKVADGNYKMNTYKNGAETGFSILNSITAVAQYSTYSTAARGTYTFAAGDIISVLGESTGGFSGTVIHNGFMEVVFND